MRHILGLLMLTSVAAAQTTVTAVLDAGAYTNNLAQGSIFVVKGTGLSAAGLVATGSGFPTALNNVRISLTAVSGGAIVQSPMVYPTIKAA
jgi:uncharacterized protein (TIGR03437 family)